MFIVHDHAPLQSHQRVHMAHVFLTQALEREVYLGWSIISTSIPHFRSTRNDLQTRQSWILMCPNAHGGFLSHRGTPSYHPFLDGILPNKNHPAMGVHIYKTLWLWLWLCIIRRFTLIYVDLPIIRSNMIILATGKHGDNKHQQDSRKRMQQVAWTWDSWCSTYRTLGQKALAHTVWGFP